MKEQAPRLVMEGIDKEFPGVKALSNVNLTLYPGEVHALMGENGAGKSTLIKVLTGVYTIDKGTVTYEGKDIHVKSPHDAQDMGITTVYQEVNLCTNLSVTENIFIGREIMKNGRIKWKEMNKRAVELLKRLNLDIDVTKLLSSYSVAIQQMVAIARSLNVSAKVLILDEPTSSLDRDEVKQLFAVINKLKSEGMAIVFVSHFLEQVYEISDRITVLRNGEWVGEYAIEDLPRLELVGKMIGKELNEMSSISKERKSSVKGEAILHAQNLSKKGRIEPYDLELHKGEIVGLAGLLGSGRTELARLLFGADKADTGELKISGNKKVLKTPKQAIANRIAFCSEDRKAEGIIPELTIRENMILAMQGMYGWFKYISKKRQMEIADEYTKLLNINPPNPEQLIKNLSGGNQQKVMLARWLITNPEVLILDEPTRGIDIGAKTEIMKLMVKLSGEGMSILFISGELEEILRTCDRIAVLRDRKKVSEIVNKDHQTQHEVMTEMAGGV
ncbi:sugar ABC transporter ATP-binding protein [Aquibacillus koreensis]|uniref:Sugar ABC transporter ATP-binding protein n=1 Tax=Aquibacillus koreensis TaxID=279446 RepID=A0A9X3WQL7_9BACI|nr:sugar ABC transporter ATP-binding protein [Aquibacillus koreensis]MCT2537216.1 sugar ABC transporter ATP-binding protein [Aquibacillus koreensis]MDC3421564.1 sugar ABC transporter ATP-binding protein [Aquibacillus koreensis]